MHGGGRMDGAREAETHSVSCLGTRNIPLSETQTPTFPALAVVPYQAQQPIRRPVRITTLCRDVTQDTRRVTVALWMRESWGTYSLAGSDLVLFQTLMSTD